MSSAIEVPCQGVNPGANKDEGHLLGHLLLHTAARYLVWLEGRIDDERADVALLIH